MEVLEFILDTWFHFGILMTIGAGLALRHDKGYIDLADLITLILFGTLSYFGFLLLIIFVIIALLAEFGDKKLF